MIAQATPDKITKRWMRDASDDLAVSRGCWFDEDRGQFVVNWLYDYLRLYEGESAGERFQCKDWQYEATMRLFGWVQKSEDWGRIVRRFRSASIWVPKKNKKSPTLAAWCVYMTCGDGEQGQKCFPTAKNGNQIRENVGKHIHEMIRQSPELMAECSLNKQTKQVLHEPSRSVIMPLSSENIQTQKALEGLNGSTFVDEVHVVDKAHITRISRAGISRAEPLHVEVSTAGNEPESYGMGRFKYAQGVVDGTNKDIHTLAIVHAAHQETSEEEIHADPLKYGRIANPSMGHTVKESEFLHDYETSKKSITDFADFCMYRLNIWQQSSNPWISIHDWRACPATPERPDPSREIYAGLDLSRTTDFTAWVLYQPGDVPKLWGHYWCPRRRAIELSAKFEIPILDWERQGWVTLCDEPQIPRKIVHDKIRSDSETYRHLKYFGFDRALMCETVGYCQDELGLDPVEIAQGVMSLNTPSKMLEEMAINRAVDTSGDPVLDWMIQNTSVHPDSNGNIKPLKAPGGIRKHIDGVVAAVMGIYVAQTIKPKAASIYETAGMLTL